MMCAYSESNSWILCFILLNEHQLAARQSHTLDLSIEACKCPSTPRFPIQSVNVHINIHNFPHHTR
jgi:hypothetical protein